MARLEARSWRVLVWVCLPWVLAGCPPKKANMRAVDPEAASAVSAADAEDVVRLTPEWAVLGELKAVHFETDRSELGPEARETLKRNARLIKALLAEVPGAQVRAEGHCDERNTIEYNLALGERRARVVRDYYIALGIDRKRIGTVSYGEERPVCRESSEPCWGRNRRTDTAARSGGGSVNVPRARLATP